MGFTSGRPPPPLPPPPGDVRFFCFDFELPFFELPYAAVASTPFLLLVLPLPLPPLTIPDAAFFFWRFRAGDPMPSFFRRAMKKSSRAFSSLSRSRFSPGVSLCLFPKRFWFPFPCPRAAAFILLSFLSALRVFVLLLPLALPPPPRPPVNGERSFGLIFLAFGATISGKNVSSPSACIASAAARNKPLTSLKRYAAPVMLRPTSCGIRCASERKSGRRKNQKKTKKMESRSASGRGPFSSRVGTLISTLSTRNAIISSRRRRRAARFSSSPGRVENLFLAEEERIAETRRREEDAPAGPRTG